ncbi:hypothetical protein F5Y04DRAFT_16850 [Hypomontagnella monticulosa]|nr:hypothetical protein F5Y04DRAFT_16850 [Hypomontagnella monticulosa]
MKTSILAFASALALALGVNGVPTDPTVAIAAMKEASMKANGIVARDVMEKRAQHCVYVCTRAEFSGLCENECAQSGVCFNVPSSFNDQISSLGPDSGYCRAFFDRDCQIAAGHFDFVKPGYDDLSHLGGGESNDKISSWMCWDN